MTYTYRAPFIGLPDGDFRVEYAAFMPSLDGLDTMNREDADDYNRLCAVVSAYCRLLNAGLNAASCLRGLTGHPGGIPGDHRDLKDDRSIREQQESRARLILEHLGYDLEQEPTP